MNRKYFFLLFLLFITALVNGQKRKMVSYKPMHEKLIVKGADASVSFGPGNSTVEFGLLYGRASAKKRPRINNIGIRHFKISDLSSWQLEAGMQHHLYRPTNQFIFMLTTGIVAGYNYKTVNKDISPLCMGFTLGQIFRINPQLPQAIYIKGGMQENIYFVGGLKEFFNMAFIFGLEYHF